MSGVSGIAPNSFVPPSNDEGDDKSVYSQESARSELSVYSQGSAVENRTAPQLDLDPSSLGGSSAPAPRRPLAQNTMTSQSADSSQQQPSLGQKRQLGQFIEGSSGNSGAPAQISPLRRGIGGTMTGQSRSTEQLQKEPEEKFFEESAPGTSTGFRNFKEMGIGRQQGSRLPVSKSMISSPLESRGDGDVKGSTELPAFSASRPAPPTPAQLKARVDRQNAEAEEKQFLNPRQAPRPPQASGSGIATAEASQGRGQVGKKDDGPKTFAEMGVTTGKAEKPTSVSKRIGRLFKPSEGSDS